MKFYAYYLPQFHTIPENDEWWGKGFTEWTNVKKAKPLFKSHVQPLYPLNDNYYVLDNPNTLKWQAKLANDYKIDGMIFYHYYFCGKKLLEKPAEILLKNKDIPMNYFFCWANHSWYRSWEGSKQLLLEQNYGNEHDWNEHFLYLLPFFKDSRYQKIGNKPVFMLFNSLFNEKNLYLEFLDKKCKEHGFDGICVIETLNFIKENRFKSFSYKLNKFKAHLSSVSQYTHIRQPSGALEIKFTSHFSFFRILNKIRRNLRKLGFKCVEKYDGNDLYSILNRNIIKSNNIINGLFFEWDNTPRHSYRGYVITPPEKEKVFQYLDSIKNDEFVFINAWNEWCEGMVMEPTVKNGYKYLEWIRDWKNSSNR